MLFNLILPFCIEKLLQNAHKPGWLTMSHQQMQQKLREERKEVDHEYVQGNALKEIYELADEINCCAFKMHKNMIELNKENELLTPAPGFYHNCNVLVKVWDNTTKKGIYFERYLSHVIPPQGDHHYGRFVCFDHNDKPHLTASFRGNKPTGKEVFFDMRMTEAWDNAEIIRIEDA